MTTAETILQALATTGTKIHSAVLHASLASTDGRHWDDGRLLWTFNDGSVIDMDGDDIETY